MGDNFLSYIAQLKNKHKETKFNPMFFNGILHDIKEDVSNTINLFVSMPKNPSQQFIKALTLNLNNPNIESILVFINCHQNMPVTHAKLKYVKCSKEYGLKIIDITCYFKENQLNIFMYDMIVLDYKTTTYLRYLTNTQLAVLSAKIFEETIPDDPNTPDNASVHKNITTEFNAIAVLGKIDEYDLFLDMYGSINMLISYIYFSYEIVNVSKIILSYMFEKSSCDNTYISETFPIIHVTAQLYFMEDLTVVIPSETILEEFGNEIADCIVLENIEYTQDVLPLEDQLVITDIKNKLRSEILLNCKVEFEKQIKTITLECDNLSTLKRNEIAREYDKQKKEKQAELAFFFQEEKRKYKELLDVQQKKEKEELTIKIQGIEAKAKLEVEQTKESELKKMNAELKKRIEEESVKTNKIIEDTRTLAETEFKSNFEKYTKKAYADLEQYIGEKRQESLREVDNEMKGVAASKLHEMDQNYLIEKKRREDQLNEEDENKRQEFDSLHKAKYLEKFSKTLIEMEAHFALVKQGRMAELEEEMNILRNEMERKYKTEDLLKRQDLEKSAKAYLEEKIKEQDKHAITRETQIVHKQNIMLERKRKKDLEDLEEIHRVKQAEVQEHKAKQLKEINIYLHQHKENQLSKLQISKQIQDNEIIEERLRKEKELDREISIKRNDIFKEMHCELEEEKKRKNQELEKEYIEKLKKSNEEHEHKHKIQLQEKIHNLEAENEIFISKLLTSTKHQHEEYLQQMNKEKDELERSIIENHNKQLRDLQKEYQEKIDFHKLLLKETVKDERQSLLMAERESMEEGLKAYKQKRMHEIDDETLKEMAKYKHDKLLLMEQELVKIKEDKVEKINSELSRWKEEEEEILKKRFQNLYSDLKGF